MTDLQAVHERALTRFATIQSAIRDVRLQCASDRAFVSVTGAMWQGDLQRQFENKPRFEFNKISLAIMRIFSEYRNNRIEAKFSTKDGDKNDKLADVCAALYRADNQDSDSEEAKDNAFDEAVTGGFGAYRLRACYEDEEDDENDKQRIVFETINDADTSVFFDLDSKRQDKSDANFAYIVTAKNLQNYIEEYDDSPSTWPQELKEYILNYWQTQDVVYIAEYYEVEKKTEKFQIWKSITGETKKYSNAEFKDNPELLNELLALGSKKISEKSIKRRCVHKYIMSGGKVLEDCGIIAGKYIPIVPVYGKRFFIDNIERCFGQVRLAKDAQMLKNMQMSKLAEISALSTIEKPIVTPEQIAGHQVMWQDDNIKNYPYLLINPVTDMSGNETISAPVAYTRAPQVPPAMVALLQTTEADIQSILGNQQQAEQIVANTSGKAVELVQNRVDMQTFIYLNNAAKAEKCAAKIWLSMGKDIYVEDDRKMKGINENGDKEYFDLNKEVINEDGEYEILTLDADMDIAVDIGASSSSKRQSTIRTLGEMMAVTSDPETKNVLGAMAVLNMEGEGIGSLRDYFRIKLIKMGVVKPTKEEAAQLEQEAANMPPDANTLYLQKAAEQAEAEAKRANADTVYKIAQVEKVQADSEKSKADTLKTLQDIDQTKLDSLLRLLSIVDNQQNNEVM